MVGMTVVPESLSTVKHQVWVALSAGAELCSDCYKHGEAAPAGTRLDGRA